MSLDFPETRCNEEAARLLPWYVTGRLSAADTERVAAHLQRCSICRDDVARETAIHALVKSDGPVEYAPQAGLTRTLSRIDELERDAPPPDRTLPPVAPAAPVSRGARRSGALQWLSAAVVVQAVALGWLGVSLRHAAQAPAVPAYHTLSTDAVPAGGPHVRVVFAPALTLAELGALLAADHLLIVSGPTRAGVYTLASTDALAGPAQLDPLVAKLRGDGRVLFAELAVNDAAPPP